MSAGLPIISYDLKEAKKSADKAALFIPYNNEREFAKAVCNLMDHPECRKEMSRVALERFTQNFRQDFSQKELLTAYNLIYANQL
jgi:glycosyltransferase involved in cell wall biosynthesis